MMRPGLRRAIVWSTVAAGLLIVVAANWHLISVAVTSQPDCVMHVRAGDRDGPPGMLRAARSSCTPRVAGDAGNE